MPRKPDKTQALDGYLKKINTHTDVIVFICPTEDAPAWRMAFNRKKKDGQRLSFRTKGKSTYGIIACENIKNYV